MKKAILIDLDGTLLATDCRVPKIHEFIRYLKETDNEIIINTGRTFPEVKRLLGERICNNINYFICLNGHHLVNNVDLKRVQNHIESIDPNEFIAFRDNVYLKLHDYLTSGEIDAFSTRIYTNLVTVQSKLISDQIALPKLYDWMMDMLYDNFVTIGISGLKEDIKNVYNKLLEIMKAEENCNSAVIPMRVDDRNVQLSIKPLDKMFGFKLLCDTYNLDLHLTHVFGNNFNDKSMYRNDIIDYPYNKVVVMNDYGNNRDFINYIKEKNIDDLVITEKSNNTGVVVDMLNQI